jgi:predicted adenylyl cyclase CyaB
MREVELKSVVEDLQAAKQAVERAGGVLQFEGNLFDLRYADRGRQMIASDHVLRLRIYDSGDKLRGHLDWKGPTHYENGYKIRDELSSTVGDPDALAAILGQLGYIVVREIDRRITQYSLLGSIVRFEEYPRMDVLVEVEGTPESIEQAIAAIGLPREGFTSERLPAFVMRFEQRSGHRAALSRREMAGDYDYHFDDA